jgi:L-seryl-tRNA(Ser) seleniumtransferase
MDSLLGSALAEEPLRLYGRAAVKEELRRAIEGARGDRPEALIETARAALARRFAPTLTRAINATGVLLHTNLGRAPLGETAREALREVAAGYSTLEYEAATGQRGKRQDHVRALVRDVFGVPDGLAVNNNAAALLLALTALSRGRQVLVSRGELVAIGGSFKIPEILEASGARLAEVGTTNRTTIDDYRRALTPETAMVLTVHPSNYEIRGYTARPAPEEVSALARGSRVLWLHDQGTGCVQPLEEFGVAGEPTVADCLAAGADLVSFSCDKLLSGPQAGLIVGRAEPVATLAGHPVARAVRPDKLALAALAATLSDWKRGSWRDFPVYRAAARTLAELERRGAALAAGASGGALEARVEASEAMFGGGTSPEKRFASRALALSHGRLGADELAARLRGRRPPIVGRVEEQRLWLDLRSVDPAEDTEIAAALAELR